MAGVVELSIVQTEGPHFQVQGDLAWSAGMVNAPLKLKTGQQLTGVYSGSRRVQGSKTGVGCSSRTSRLSCHSKTHPGRSDHLDNAVLAAVAKRSEVALVDLRARHEPVDIYRVSAFDLDCLQLVRRALD